MKPSRWIVCGLLAVALAGAAWLPLRAQNDTLPAEVAALFDDIADIDKLRILNPLKLTPEQLDSLIAAIRKSQKEYNSKLVAAVASPMRELAQEIKETRRKMLTGGSVPKEFDDRLKKIKKDYDAVQERETPNTLKSLADAVRKVLTKEQMDVAVSLARTLTAKNGKPTLKGTDEQFFNGYVLGTFIVYPRIVPLLEEMKKTVRGE